MDNCQPLTNSKFFSGELRSISNIKEQDSNI